MIEQKQWNQFTNFKKTFSLVKQMVYTSLRQLFRYIFETILENLESCNSHFDVQMRVKSNALIAFLFMDWKIIAIP